MVMVKPNFLSIKCQLTYLLAPFLKHAKEPQAIRLPLISLFQPKNLKSDSKNRWALLCLFYLFSADCYNDDVEADVTYFGDV